MLIKTSFDPAKLQASHGGTILAHGGLPTHPALPFGSAFGVIRKGMAQERMVQGEGGKIYVPIGGSALIIADGESYTAQPGDVIFFPPGTDHEVRHTGEEDFRNFCLWWTR